MTDEPFAWEPQFQADGEAWRKIVLKTDDLASRISGYATAADLLLGEIIRYGTINDSKMIRDIEDLYDHLLSIGVSVQMRREVYRHIAGFQQNTSFVSANAHLPFIACEPDRGICSTAVIDYVSMAPSRPADPISSVQDIIGMISARFPRNVGAAFGGLLYLGDRRVCRLLWAQLRTSYRLPPLAQQYASDFAHRFLPATSVDLPDPAQRGLDVEGCGLRWVQCSPGGAIQTCEREVLRLMEITGRCGLANADITFLTDDRSAGAEVAQLLMARNIAVLSTFHPTTAEQRREKMSFYMGDARIKATTLQSFKGWEARLLVVHVSRASGSESLALIYAGLTRLKQSPEGSFLTVICAAPELGEYGQTWPDQTHYEVDVSSPLPKGRPATA